MSRLEHYINDYSIFGAGLGTQDPAWRVVVPNKHSDDIHDAMNTPAVNSRTIAEEYAVDRIVNEFDL